MFNNFISQLTTVNKIYEEGNISRTNEKLFLRTAVNVLNYRTMSVSRMSLIHRSLLRHFGNQWLHNNVPLFANLHTREKSFDKSNHGLIVYARKPQVGTDRRKPAREAREERRRG